jgi:8-oxo-dGTP pyrophosphatase MutT (NUDIX family)
MAHIHDRIDFTVAIFIAHEGRVLLVHDRRLNKWLPVGGRIERLQTPMDAAVKWYCRKALEEIGSPAPQLPGRTLAASAGSSRERIEPASNDPAAT